jgi:hypothetical protein
MAPIDRLTYPRTRPMHEQMTYHLTCGHRVVTREQTCLALAEGVWEYCKGCDEVRKIRTRRPRCTGLAQAA